MKKALIFLLIFILSLSFTACGEDTEPGQNAESANTPAEEVPSDSTETPDEAEPIISDEEFMGVYISDFDNNKTVIFREDSIALGLANFEDYAVDFYVSYGWEINGNILTVFEATGMGDATFEIVKTEDTIKLEFKEFVGGDGGAFGGYPEFITTLTKLPAE